MDTVKSLRLPESLLRSVRYLARRERLDESTAIRQLIALGTAEYAVRLYREGKITLNEAAELATIAIAPPDTACLNYGFDVTPARLITGLISERGIMEAKEEDILRLYPEQR